MVSRLLIANRGEIACRIIRTARRMGIATIAVYSDADARALHVAMADEAVRIGPAPAAESYLAADSIIEAAKRTGADAIHPGYGFLSENPDFAQAVEAAGLVFVGPTPAAIRAMGLKDAARKKMEAAGVPVVPGYHGEAQQIVILASKAHEIGYPVLIKARAGGGGRGMRRVDAPDAFAEALAAARREARATFGDSHVLVEKYIDRARHIEVQVFADNHGEVVHLFERDCSAQRRHQKVIEEAPAPAISDAMRAAMTEAAVAAARAISYRGAGTVEFIADASDGLRPDRFWFMEMNTRLQVEHPVTEMLTGLDLVEWQLRVAAGERLPLRQEEIVMRGHAFEARLYAEDAAQGFLPAAGTLHHLRFPDQAGAKGASVRIDTGMREGDSIPPYYDPLIAKLVVHAESRPAALASLRAALEQTHIAGTAVNTAFLATLAADPAFTAGHVDTAMIERRQEELTALPAPSPAMVAAAALAAAAPSIDPHSADPWESLAGYAHFHPLEKQVRLSHGGEEIAAGVTIRPDGRAMVTANSATTVLPLAGGGHEVARWPGHVTVFAGAVAHDFAVADPSAPLQAEAAGDDTLRAPMPGLVKLVSATAGEKVAKDQILLVLEAMKMEHIIAAPRDGTIGEIVAQGEQVAEGVVLVHFAGEV